MAHTKCLAQRLACYKHLIHEYDFQLFVSYPKAMEVTEGICVTETKIMEADFVWKMDVRPWRQLGVGNQQGDFGRDAGKW